MFFQIDLGDDGIHFHGIAVNLVHSTFVIVGVNLRPLVRIGPFAFRHVLPGCRKLLALPGAYILAVAHIGIFRFWFSFFTFFFHVILYQTR